ncbi:MAG: TetR/AcrR family transcriptional regulator [Cyanobacteriota/Melainabacteria group bacterium]
MARTKAIPNRDELIVEKAKELFASKGYEKTSIADIARELGIGKGSVYLDFGSKEEILIRIVQKFAMDIEARMFELADTKEGSTLEVMRSMFKEQIMLVYDNVSRDFHTPEALLHTSVQFKARFSDFHVRKRELVTRLLKEAAAKGEIDKGKANQETAVAFLMSVSCLYPPYINNFSEAAGRVTREGLDRDSDLVLEIALGGLKRS